MGKGQNVNINKSLEEVDSNPCEWFWEDQDSIGGSNCSCGGNNKSTRMRTGAYRCKWIHISPW